MKARRECRGGDLGVAVLVVAMILTLIYAFYALLFQSNNGTISEAWEKLLTDEEGGQVSRIMCSLGGYYPQIIKLKRDGGSVILEGRGVIIKSGFLEDGDGTILVRLEGGDEIKVIKGKLPRNCELYYFYGLPTIYCEIKEKGEKVLRILRFFPLRGSIGAEKFSIKYK